MVPDPVSSKLIGKIRGELIGMPMIGLLLVVGVG